MHYSNRIDLKRYPTSFRRRAGSMRNSSYYSNYSQRDFFMEVRERQWMQKKHYYNMRRYADMLHERSHMEQMHRS